MAYRANQVEEHVLDLAERLGPGAMLPGERGLAVECGVSRMTVRRALRDLELRRVVERKHGAGTFVRRPAAAQPLLATSFTDDMHRRGFAPSSRLIGEATERADSDTAANLGCDRGAEVAVIRRLRLADGVPMALETLRVPTARVPGLTGAEIVDASYHDVLRTRFGRRVTSGKQLVEPVVLDDDAAGLLETGRGSAALRFVRTTRDQYGDVVELVDAVYRADRYLVEVDVLLPG